MITGIVFLLILIGVALRGGDLKRMAEVRPKMAWTVMAAVAIQFVIITLLGDRMPFAVASGLHLFSYGLALVFVWANRNIRGILLTVLGGIMNLVAIAANGGVMPASAAALEFAGKVPDAEAFENSSAQEDAKLLFLGDVFAFPHGMPFANIFSLGDIVLVVGGYVLISRQCLDQFRDDEEETDPVVPSPAVAGAAPAWTPQPIETEWEPTTPPPGWIPDPEDASRKVWWTGAEVAPYRTTTTPPGRRPGWYPDPQAPHVQRWWTGAEWTSMVTQPSPAAQPAATHR